MVEVEVVKLWISYRQATGMIGMDESGVITFAPPIWHRFKGQKAKKLVDWLEAKFGEVELEEL